MYKINKFRYRVSLLALSSLLLLSGCGTADTATNTEEKYTPIEVEAALVQNLTETTVFSGKISAEQEVAVVPKLPGKVTAVNVQVGDDVQAGAVLFSLDTQDLQNSVDMATLGVSSAQVNYQHTKEQVELAKTNLERQKQLYAAGAISKAQLEGYEIQASEVPLQLVQNQLEQAKIGLSQAQNALSNASVTAPIAGTVAQVNVKYGEMASAAIAAVKLTKLDDLNVTFDVPENIVNQLQTGQTAKITVLTIGEAEFEGKIVSIAPASDAMTKLFPVKIAIANQEGLLKPGMFAKVRLSTQTKNEVLAVRSEAILLKNGKQLIYVVEDNKAAVKEITTGLDTGDLVEITQGLNPGEQVIIKGQTLVEQGGNVKIVGGNAS